MDVGQDTLALRARLLYPPLALTSTSVKSLSCTKLVDGLDLETRARMVISGPCPAIDPVSNTALVLFKLGHDSEGHCQIEARTDMLLDRGKVVLASGMKRILFCAGGAERRNIFSAVN